MSTIFWKELRENLKWAVIGMVGVSLLLIYALYLNETFDSGSESVVSYLFLLGTTIGCAVLGGGLGLKQTLSERHTDQWAYLIHRPATLTQIFIGKVGAGLLLYLAATIVPLGGVVWWVNTPGHVGAPFEWIMMIPAGCDCLMGVLYYLAGLLTGIRRGRWFGTKAIGFAICILGTFSINSDKSVAAVPITAISFGLLLLVAAWGTFRAQGYYARQPLLSKMALTALMTAAVGLISAIIILMFLSSVGFKRDQDQATYRFTVDGRILIAKDSGTQPETYLDLLGQSVAPPEGRSRFAESDFLNSQNLVTPHLESWSYRDSKRYLQQVYSNDVSGEVRWIYQKSSAVFREYSRKTKKQIGAMGSNGYHGMASLENVRPFPGKTRTRYGTNLWLYDQGAYLIDFKHYTSAPLFVSTTLEKPLGSLRKGEYDETQTILIGLPPN